ncbi:hypothetical protein J4573_45950 [Actinomadura barringtoniae]|uniref:Uncharacterized protein n=1 Tax=Actinomadura barringtoniae TaxID=1427535 RepID=A0A939PTI7_9ACTN|nr:hypothetical protein [Actinomadura barringtoniae]MBO2454501.1 hypothetical protein [Actinomadura barringtoniae]
MMLRKLAVAGVAGGVVGLVLVAPAHADTTGSSAKAPAACSFGKPTKFSKVVELKRGSVHAGTKWHPNGSVTGRYEKWHKSQEGEGYYAPYGKAKTRYFAAKPVVCLIGHDKQGRLTLHKASRTQLRATVNKRYTWRDFGLVYNKQGRVTKLVQIYHP